MSVWRWGCTALGTVVCPLSPHTEQLLSPPLGPEREVNALLWGTDSDLTVRSSRPHPPRAD